MKQDDIFIRVIQYAVEKNGAFDLIQMFEELEVSGSQKSMLADQIGHGNLLAHNKNHDIINRCVKETRAVDVWCSAVDRFRLLEYQELTEARESSLSANKMATKAIVISIISFLSGIAFSWYQVSNPITLPKQHYKEMSNIVELLSSKSRSDEAIVLEVNKETEKK
ncbi:hypothetical protein CSW98_01530 [Vibrio sp. HA2012]|uniref:hypothetical protein n=1 Tax=Vibrio sp. HA2012 TaxID=1971595 RepID=UPI000C2BFE35|nr:hypothetical protein [Vibrio sp. HA2012]PJC87833.1 hypothetical protein CSW98_01530 [Vibrio sp. HA2012]